MNNSLKEYLFYAYQYKNIFRKKKFITVVNNYYVYVL